MDKYETFETTMADAQYLREFYDWNKARHPEWDGTYVLEIAKKREERAMYLKYEQSIDEYWIKLRDFLRETFNLYMKENPVTKENKNSYGFEFLKSLKELNAAARYIENEGKTIWVSSTGEYDIYLASNEEGLHVIYLFSVVIYKNEEQNKFCRYTTDHYDDNVIGIIGKEVK